MIVSEVGKNSLYVTQKMYYGLFYFFRKEGSTLAAATSFYAIISLLPFSLLLINLLSSFLSSSSLVEKGILTLLMDNLPESSSLVIPFIKNLMSKSTQLETKVKVFNYAILIWTCTGVFRSIFSSFTIIDESHKTKKSIMHLKSLISLLMIIFFLITVLFWTPTLEILLSSLEKNGIISSVANTFSSFPGMNFQLSIVDSLRSFILTLSNSKLFPMIFTIGFVSLFYRYLIGKKIDWLDAFSGGITFGVMHFLGKNFFWVYLYYAKDGLTRNYGQFYSVIVVFMWVYYVLSSFYFGACVGSVKIPKKERKV